MKPNEFITADTHFGHKAMINFAGRPFREVDHMDNGMVAAWNTKVPKNAVVYHLGDFSFLRPERTIALLRRLNGTIRLVRGNHDGNNLNAEVLSQFDWARDLYESRTENGTKIIMCHYPLMTWKGSHRGVLHCHGHSHGNLFDSGTTRVDVGVDTTDDYAPLSYPELMQRFEGRTYQTVDHHVPRG